ncbi:MAG: hypothetical protein PUP93_24320 [Rhizonema sp. NSF051]|nr:hypothetical protein [Rhizonema sp. NSF051]
MEKEILRDGAIRFNFWQSRSIRSLLTEFQIRRRLNPLIFKSKEVSTIQRSRTIAKQFHAELEYRCYSGSLYGESIALAFSLYLLEKYSRRSRSLPRSHGKLSGLQLRQCKGSETLQILFITCSKLILVV